MVSVTRRFLSLRVARWSLFAIAGILLALIAGAALTLLPEAADQARMGRRSATVSSSENGVASRSVAAPAGKLAMEAPSVPSAAGGAAPVAVSDRSAAQSPALPSVPPLGSLVDRMIVKTGFLSLRVTELHEAVQRVGDVVQSIPGAYVASSSTSYRGDAPIPAIGAETRSILPPGPVPPVGQSATVTLKVPAEAFDNALQRLRQLGTPLTETISTQEVTEEYVDLEAQVRALEATEQQYLRLLDKADRIEEILPIQQRITEVRSQIDRLRGRMNLLQRRADLSTITVSLTIAPGLGTTAAGEPRIVHTLRLAVSGLSTVLLNALDVLIYVAVYALPFLPLLLLYRWWRGRQAIGRQTSPSAGGAVS